MASEKQIFAAVEAADHEIRLIVGEFFNTRFNIIKVERVPVSGMSYNKVTDPEEVTKAVSTAAADAQKMIGAAVKKVILAIPSYRAKRYSFKSTVDVEGIDGVVTIQDVRNAIKKAESMDIGRAYALIRQSVSNIQSTAFPQGGSRWERNARN